MDAWVTFSFIGATSQRSHGRTLKITSRDNEQLSKKRSTSGGKRESRSGVSDPAESPGVRRRMNNELNFPPNFERLVLGCIDADVCK